MSFFNDFPHTREYDQDVGWLIHEFKKLVEQYNELLDKTGDQQAAIDALQKWVKEFNNEYIEHVVSQWLMTAIFIEISDSGHIIYYIPKAWDNVKFGTTGYDTYVPEVEYGHLTLKY